MHSLTDTIHRIAFHKLLTFVFLVDTCIIFDSDWNPQNDLQAQARCHRIGQTKSVKVYRLLSRKTYEMQMFHMSSLKMGLDQAVLKGFESGSSGEVRIRIQSIDWCDVSILVFSYILRPHYVCANRVP